MLGALAVVGALTVVPAMQRAPAAKQGAVVAKSQPAPQKASTPAQRTTPIPRPRPPAAISRPERKAVKKQRVAGLPSCSAVRTQYESMTHAQRLAAYARATAEQVAHGRRCLGI